MMEEEEASQPLVPNRCFHHTRVGSLLILSVVRNLTPVPMPLPIFRLSVVGCSLFKGEEDRNCVTQLKLYASDKLSSSIFCCLSVRHR